MPQQAETPSVAGPAPITKKELGVAVFVGAITLGLSLLFAVMASHSGKALTSDDAGSALLVRRQVPDPCIMALIVAFGINYVAWIPASILRTEHFYDLTGGTTFLSIVVTAIAVGRYADQAASWLQLLPAAFVGVWAVRLSAFLFYRVVTSERGDKRFDEMKRNPARFFVPWTIQGMWAFVTSIAMVAQVTTQGASSSLIPRGEVGGLLDGQNPTSLEHFFDFCTILGITMWVVGFSLEVTADFQKLAFARNPANRGRFISTGVWSWCRHPNYFGEITLWLGIFIMGIRSYHDTQWVVTVSPLFVTVLLLKVSGLPQLETYADKKWGAEAEYVEFKRNTHVMIPFLSRIFPSTA